MPESGHSNTTGSTHAIVADRLHKHYLLGERASLGRTMQRMLRRAQPLQPFGALEDVSFTVRRGECFGLVGGNGSGKSTILQIITAITLPTSGSVRVQGRVLPLLAIGSGFHQELTGRENVTLFGTILGLRPEEIVARMDNIVAFAELERYIDTPNKRYSDGMQARLSFAVGMLFPADIYILDEVLATVDGEFRARCIDEIEHLVAAGRTVLFVSHDLAQSRALCDRVLWMERGRVHQLGEAQNVLDAYERSTAHES